MSTLTEKYIDAVNEADVEGLIALFATTATLSQRDRMYVGADEIAAFYRLQRADQWRRLSLWRNGGVPIL